MRNSYRGVCYRCGQIVAPRAGHFERKRGKWLTQHAECAIAYRGDGDRTGPRPVDTADAERIAEALRRAIP